MVGRVLGFFLEMDYFRIFVVWGRLRFRIFRELVLFIVEGRLMFF